MRPGFAARDDPFRGYPLGTRRPPSPQPSPFSSPTGGNVLRRRCFRERSLASGAGDGQRGRTSDALVCRARKAHGNMRKSCVHDREAVKCAARDREGTLGGSEVYAYTDCCTAVCAMSLYVSDSIECVTYRGGVE